MGHLTEFPPVGRGTALAFLLIEHGWRKPLFDVIAEDGGTLFGVKDSSRAETGC